MLNIQDYLIWVWIRRLLLVIFTTQIVGSCNLDEHLIQWKVMICLSWDQTGEAFSLNFEAEDVLEG